MYKLREQLKQAEGRRIEFKEALPNKSELAKTVLAFANDAGGEIFLGIKDNPREFIGIDENELLELEEKIASTIFDQCTPPILPEISFLQIEEKYILHIKIHKGHTPPYFLKNKNIDSGTYIRVGSTNRLASPEIIAELARQKQNISFDSQLIFNKNAEQLDIASLRQTFLEKTGEALSEQVLKKLGLIRDEQGAFLPTIALLLMSDDELRNFLFPYSKIECARFKGTEPGNFIDQKTITTNIVTQAEQAYQFVLRHISQGSKDYVGVYRNDRWEYPIIAIREIIRNAVIHRDYSLTGKDIKIAIFDDKIEFTSPGKIMPSVDFNDMDSGQSDIRNKTLAPAFKRLGIIEQWGNGLRLISKALRDYPEIGFSWDEPGLSFRITLRKTAYAEKKQDDINDPSQEYGTKLGTKSGLSRDQVLKGPEELIKLTDKKFLSSGAQIAIILKVMENPQPISTLMEALEWKNRSKFRDKYIKPLLDQQMIEMTLPKKPNSPKQQYIITIKGKEFLNNLTKKMEDEEAPIITRKKVAE
jgi:ATP-dependent DNA helicase RecG